MTKPKKFRKISEKITVTMAAWLFVFTLLATWASYLHVSSIVTALMSDSLKENITLRADREDQLFELAERNQRALARELVSHLEGADKGGLSRVREFDQIFRRSKDGAVRERDEIDNTQHPSFFVPPSIKLTSDVKSQLMMMYEFMERECYVTLTSFSDCWVSDARGSVGNFLIEERSYAHQIPADFKNLEQVWMTVIDPQHNPERKSRWTPTYLDPNIDLWVVTLATPLYLGDKFLGAIGNDIFLGQIVDRTVHLKMAGTKNFIFNSDGVLVAHPDFQDRIQKSLGRLSVGDVMSEDPTLKEAHELAIREMPRRAPFAGGRVFELDAENWIAIAKLDGPDWYMATLYPKSLITTAALNASRFILIFFCVSLILEVALLMWLISQRLERPLSELVKGVQKVSAGDLQAKVFAGTNDELQLLSEAFNEMTYNLGISRAESQAAVVKATEAARVKSDFVSNISHEMRTPLNGILGMTHFLSETNLSEEQKKYASLIAESGNNLLAIVNQVLDVAKIEAQKHELNEAPFNLMSVLDDVRTVCGFAAKQKGLPLDFESSIDGQFWGDGPRLRQILANLVGNAVKFSSVGSISLRVTELDSRAPFKRLRFEVRDQGVGMSEEVQSRLFKPFAQGDSSMSRSHGGTGLGLFLVKSFAELMGGTVSLSSRLGEGSTFRVEIPLRTQPPASARLPKAPVPAAALQNVKPILIVEDNFVNIVLTEALIKKLGFTSQVAKDGREAVEAFASGRFSMILMDCQMPIMDGYEATREIRRLETQGTRTPIVALTANTSSEDRERCLESGMDDMLSKPVKIAVFKEKIEYWLSRAESSAA
ncbi:MAG: response regulator [Bdellovibrionaceae bacterium]|nr:response regulator [Pseudobdellovibrionaceae bacterium]